METLTGPDAQEAAILSERRGGEHYFRPV